jgi:hypothetical protein
MIAFSLKYGNPAIPQLKFSLINAGFFCGIAGFCGNPAQNLEKNPASRKLHFRGL